METMKIIEAKEKNRAYKRRWREAHPEKEHAYQRRWREAHPEERRARAKARREADPEKERARKKRWYEAHPEKNRARAKAWYEAHREEEHIRKRARLMKQYGISRDGFDAMLCSQGGACAICRRPFIGTPVVDHDHETKRVRGLLCHLCNRAIGSLQDSPTILRLAAEYLEKRNA